MCVSQLRHIRDHFPGMGSGCDPGPTSSVISLGSSASSALSCSLHPALEMTFKQSSASSSSLPSPCQFGPLSRVQAAQEISVSAKPTYTDSCFSSWRRCGHAWVSLSSSPPSLRFPSVHYKVVGPLFPSSFQATRWDYLDSDLEGPVTPATI